MRLRQWRPDDIDALADLFAVPEVWHYPFRGGLDRERAESFLARALAAQEARVPEVWAAEMAGSDGLAGYIGLAVPSWLPEEMPAVEVGWRLHPAHWGRGLATEGGAAALAYAFDVLALDRVVSMCEPENVASRRVMDKLGMRFDHETVWAGVRVHLCSLARQDWERSGRSRNPEREAPGRAGEAV